MIFILCKVVKVDLNNEDYSEDFLSNLPNPLPKVGDLTNQIRRDGYPFEVGGKDGYSLLPRGLDGCVDKNGKPCGKWLYYVTLEQISIHPVTVDTKGF